MVEFNISLVGYAAGICSAICQFPQAYKVFKTKDTHSISIGMYMTMTLGVILWFCYGILLKDWPMILANGVGLIPSIYTLILTLRNNKKAKRISQKED